MNRIRTLAFALLIALLLALAPPERVALAATYTVVNTNDSGTGSLRWAIEQANANTGVRDTIDFDIAGCGGVCTIQPLSPLPNLTDPAGVFINGYSQPGSEAPGASSPAIILIAIDGSLAGACNGLTVLSSADNEIRGLNVRSFGWNGVAIAGSAATGNVVAGNHIGTNAAGTGAQGNTYDAVFITMGAQNNTVGGSDAADRNVLSGNGWEGVGIHGGDTAHNVVAGNYIGVGAGGTAAVGNASHGVLVYGGAYQNTVGGGAAGARNVISGNDGRGVVISGTNTMSNTISGNYVGTDSTGANALGNHNSGVQIRGGASHNLVGGDSADARNVIADHGAYNVQVWGSSTLSNTISGNYIGTNAAGSAVLGDQNFGVHISDGAQGTRVGGSNATPGAACSGECNLISGHSIYGISTQDEDSTGTLISGNYIGTDVNGTSALGNNYGIHLNSPGYVIGGRTPAERNLVSGNSTHGLRINEWSEGCAILGNYIGTDVNGSANLGNGGYGLWVGFGGGVVGGAAEGEGNLISGNDEHGIYLSSAYDNLILGNSIGTDASGSAVLGNGESGIFIDECDDNQIGGSLPGQANLISGNDLHGVAMSYAEGNTVVGNYIGVNVSGTAALGNSYDGVHIEYGSEGNTIGGDAPEEGNVIAGNGQDGVQITDDGTMSNTVAGNWLGTNAAGADLGNGRAGVAILAGSGDSVVGPGNTIAYNTIHGVWIDGAATLDNVVTQSSIHDNDLLGIALTEGANGGIAPPSIDEATAIPGTAQITGTACAGCTVEVFASSTDDGEGETYVGSAVAEAGGSFGLTVPALPAPYLTATATDDADGTSEFSAVLSVTLPCVPPQEVDFGWTPTTPTAGAAVTLTAQASGTLPFTFSWDLGDGSLAAGTSVTHSYAAAGDYVVVLTAANCGGMAAATHTLSVVEACVPPHNVDFSWTPTTPTAGAAVNLSAQASGTLPFSFSWNLGDGGEASGAMIAHTYATSGTYTVTLTVENACDQAVVRQVLTVVEPAGWRIFLPVVCKNWGG